ncbi:ADP-ribosylglycohydrolase family protein [Lewinella sp. 4G2]|uniref:ADP-ribosylglycohydrolase family protein n=1 Tax=Lewinella sp. 4G2 TaxID=1803372 RepID=UPI0007B45CE6|nr:ADP-ribosylglycohydrolase family protein [Lewinella sp. 4G2]OAV45187.1 heme biosynthesis protein HemY [Lewinella sp. 4G2]
MFRYLPVLLIFFACNTPETTVVATTKPSIEDQFAGFWLGQCIANWTGLVTEMDKVGNIGDIQTGAFYTREDWGGPDQPNIWSGDTISHLSPTIDFVLVKPDSAWGADDDTDIEYIYQELLLRHDTALLSPTQIRDGWLRHIKSDEENYLWVSNERALRLMEDGTLPPATSNPTNNEHYDMIDAQLTTEIFGLYAPGDVDLALRLAELPIRVAAAEEAAEIARFYVALYALAADTELAAGEKAPVQELADAAKTQLVEGHYPRAMYEFVKARHAAGIPWEQCRDEIYQRYQVTGADGYDVTSRKLYCNGCFAAGINFAASLVSLFYGDGDFVETVKIGTLAGWDSDNPTATWGGLLGFMYGREAIQSLFDEPLSDRFWIHRTRVGFAGDGFDDFSSMAAKGVRVRELVERLEAVN